jgi:antitoxin ParD1/3/4
MKDRLHPELDEAGMNVSLTPELETWVQEKVSSGLYGSSSEVVREALRLLHEHERVRELRITELRQQLARGLESLEHGRSRVLDDALIEEIKAAGRRRSGRANS